MSILFPFSPNPLHNTSAKELKLCWEAIGSILALICSHASKTAAPYISELAEAAVGDAFGTYFHKRKGGKTNRASKHTSRTFFNGNLI